MRPVFGSVVAFHPGGYCKVRGVEASLKVCHPVMPVAEASAGTVLAAKTRVRANELKASLKVFI
jgi:uncharacterized protein YgbK (DUF1537 family)